ncbi:LysR family transcriptional regulator [Azovibrio restrictus]|uniref:LysR family transcriptional regulator n=1 Tax=Azovibrio restrictus TaxID=146938 RepID=UPI0026EAB6F1|nr:LysR family transcriptional regulator [Azovibrio restrictus]MDD3483913.1 LysR family transcriptional regulator [Azovibrio restrictus]
MPTLKQIRYFLSVAELGGFTQAAAALFIAQPALSRQIAQLETELGFPLFQREARGVSLTAAGQLYRERVHQIQEQLTAAAEAGAQLAQGKAGVLRLLHSSSTPVSSLMPTIHAFLEQSPCASIHLDRVASELQLQEVAEGRADLGVIRLPVLGREPRVQLRELEAERLWVLLPDGHPLAGRSQLGIAELREQAFVAAVHRERGGLARRVTDLCLQRGFVPATARVISRKTSMLDLVAAGFGIAVVPASMLGLRQTGITPIPLADPDALAQRALVLPQQAHPLAQAFAELLMEHGRHGRNEEIRGERPEEDLQAVVCLPAGKPVAF